MAAYWHGDSTKLREEIKNCREELEQRKRESDAKNQIAYIQIVEVLG